MKTKILALLFAILAIVVLLPLQGVRSDTLSIGAKVKHSLDQSIPSDTWTIVNWDTEVYDTGSLHDVAVNNDRFTAQVSGVYIASFSGAFLRNANGFRIVGLYRNGIYDAIAEQKGWVGSSATWWEGEVTWIGRMDAGDYIYAKVYQSSKIDLDFMSSASWVSFTIQRLGD